MIVTAKNGNAYDPMLAVARELSDLTNRKNQLLLLYVIIICAIEQTVRVDPIR